MERLPSITLLCRMMKPPPSVETLSEFKVVNSVAAEYGLSGGAFMSFATKSGTNEFHGSAFEYLRNEALDARSFFAASRAIQKQHELGLSREVLFISRNSTMVETRRFSLAHLPDLTSIAQWQGRFPALADPSIPGWRFLITSGCTDWD